MHIGGVYSKAINKTTVNYNVYKDLFLKNRNDAVLKKIFQTGVIQKIYADVLKPETKLLSSLKVAFEPLVYAGDRETTIHALRRIFRDRLWRIKHFFTGDK